MGANLYDEDFYSWQIDGSYKSASLYSSHLNSIFAPKSIIDVGCGRGAWLKAFEDIGAQTLVGLDGRWNSQDKMLSQTINFQPTDLEVDFPKTLGRFDLAMSLEVAEHLRPQFSVSLIKNITSLSDVVIFGAAYLHQGGVDHINERKHSDWAEIFSHFNFSAYDFFRPEFWGDKSVDYWYQQNTFLYIKDDSLASKLFLEAGYLPIKNLNFMNSIHPSLYERHVANAFNPSVWHCVRVLIKKFIPVFLRRMLIGR